MERRERLHHWVRANSSDFRGAIPQPRSGHSSVNIGNSKIVVFGGLVDKRFLNDIIVYDADNKLWFQPECTGSGSDGQVCPRPRAFHVAVSIDCHMFIFGGRSAGERLGDFWVLDTDIWQWSELTSFGDLPSPRDFAAAAPIGNQKIVMYGGRDGKKWLSDVYVLDTISLEWMELSISGSVPPPRCGHTATMVEKRLLVFGGRGFGGPIMGDLWALKGVIDEDQAFGQLKAENLKQEENETPGWTQLKLPGQVPSPRCGHTVTSIGHQLLIFGGHGTGGWLSHYDIYYNDCVVLDRASVQWKRLPTSNEAPPPRAYHTMTAIDSGYMLFGGFDGKSTFGDFWWLVPEGDPLLKRLASPPSKTLSQSKDAAVQSGPKDSENEKSAVSELWRRFEVSTSISRSEFHILNEAEDTEVFELASKFGKENTYVDGAVSYSQAIQVLRDHWKNSSSHSIQLKELGPLLRDYQRLVTRKHFTKDVSELDCLRSALSGKEVHRFYHVKNASQFVLVKPSFLTNSGS
ncbi:hypothetical protein V2J09_023480 [Rumex salicifolius]